MSDTVSAFKDSLINACFIIRSLTASAACSWAVYKLLTFNPKTCHTELTGLLQITYPLPKGNFTPKSDNVCKATMPVSNFSSNLPLAKEERNPEIHFSQHVADTNIHLGLHRKAPELQPMNELAVGLRSSPALQVQWLI